MMKLMTMRLTNNKIVLRIPVIIILFFSLYANAQFGFHNGYVITNENDTIHGAISDQGDMGNAVICKFKLSAKDKVIRYHPGEIKSYRFIDGKYYTTIQVIDKNMEKAVFAEVLLDDKIALYRYWKNKDQQYFLRNENKNIVTLPSEGIYIKNEENPYLTRKFYIDSYKDSLDMVFEKCKDLKPKIEEIEYKSKDLIALTKEFINCVYKNNGQYRYEKSFALTKPSAGFYAGGQISKIFFLESDIQSNFVSSFPIGIFLNIPVPMLNDRISFQPELHFNRLAYNRGFHNIPNIYSEIAISSSQLSMPLMIKYSFHNKKISPSIGIGKALAYNFNTSAKTTPVGYDFEIPGSREEFEYRQNGFLLHYSQRDNWFIDLGIDYKINARFSIFSDLRFQKYLNLILEEKYYNNYMFYVAEKKNRLDNPHSNIYRSYAGSLFFGIRF